MQRVECGPANIAIFASIFFCFLEKLLKQSDQLMSLLILHFISTGPAENPSLTIFYLKLRKQVEAKKFRVKWIFKVKKSDKV